MFINIATQYLTGSYRSNFTDIKEIKSLYSYDKSNRLKKTEKYSTKYYDLAGEYSFDPDGNFLTHARSFNGDNFNYDYYLYTNKLRKVTGTENQFTYDYNGNMTNDYLSNNTGIKYDHRNLITEIIKVDNLIDPPATYTTTYKYDEAGNRTQKTVLKNDGTIQETIVNEFYVRDAQGKEIAIYQDYELDFWNVWGMGNEGRIKSTGTNYFYLKDHLGSIRAVLNQNNELVGAIDLDAWGFLSRSWDTTSTRYKFTGKERDNESNYDYFGARYFNSRTGNWIQTEPLYDKFLSFSPYAYAINNPLKFIDIGGFIPRVTISGNTIKFEFSFYYTLFENDQKKGLDRQQIMVAEDLVKNMEKWSGEYKLNGKEFNIEVRTTIQSMEGEYDIAASNKIINEKYVNFITNCISDTEELEKNQGVGFSGEVLELIRGEKLKPYKSTGSHELGHYFKVTHSDIKSRKEKIDDTEIIIESIMGKVTIYNNQEYRDYPSQFEWELIFNRNPEYFTK